MEESVRLKHQTLPCYDWLWAQVCIWNNHENYLTIPPGFNFILDRKKISFCLDKEILQWLLKGS